MIAGFACSQCINLPAIIIQNYRQSGIIRHYSFKIILKHLNRCEILLCPAPPSNFSKDTASEFYHTVMEVCKESESLDDVHKNMALYWDDALDVTSIGPGGN